MGTQSFPAAGVMADDVRAWLVGGDGAAGASFANRVPVLGPTGCRATASFTPAAAAYSAADTMDVAKEFAFTFSDGTAIPAGSLIRVLSAVLRIDTTALQASEAGYQLQAYSVTPPSALADNAAFTLSSADLPSHQGVIGIGTPVDLGAALFVRTLDINIDVQLTTSSMWAYLQTIAGFTATAVARQVSLRAVVL
jgi:hypothetical protein